MRCDHTSRTTIARLIVIVVECIILFQLIANDTQEVTTEELAVTAFNDKGYILLLLDLCQLVAELVGQLRLLHLEA